MSEKIKLILTIIAFILALLFFLYAVIFDPLAPAPLPAPNPTPSPAYVMPAVTAPPQNYVLNKNTRRFHYPDCKSVPEIAGKNREDVFASRDELLARGFVSCGNCRP